MLDRTARLAVILASAGRPSLLADAIRDCALQERVSFRGIVSVPDEESLPAEPGLLLGWDVYVGTRGAAAQRNVGLDALNGAVDFVFFFDDDTVLRSDYMANAVAFLDANKNFAGLTGKVLADGKKTGQISREETASQIESSWRVPLESKWKYTRELYGANLVARFSSDRSIRFDSRLPLYSWLEDHDFARRLMVVGPLAYVEDCVSVHRAADSGGRQHHRRFGYSQVMNPVYLYRKGSFPFGLAVQQLFRPVLKNIVNSMLGAERPWRRRRLAGNLSAVLDVVKGRITPEKIELM